MANEYSNVADLYVVAQEDISIRGKLFTRLICTGNWGRMEMHKVMGDAIAAAPSTGTDTVKEIIDGTGSGDAMIISGMSLVSTDASSELTTKVPELKFEVFDSRGKVVRDALDLTDNLAKMRGGNLHAIERTTGSEHRITGTISGAMTPGETLTGDASGETCVFLYQSAASGAGYIVVEHVSGALTLTEDLDGATQSIDDISAIVDEHYLYELDGTHTFWEHTRSQSLLAANRVICVDKLPDTSGTLHTWTNVANDNTGDQDIFGIVTYVFEDPSVGSHAEALLSAEAKLDHFQAEAKGGVLQAPMNVGQEVHDLIQVTDSRAGWTGADVIEARVGGIERKFESGVYTMKLTFGGLVGLTPSSIDPEDLIDDVPDPVVDPIVLTPITGGGGSGTGGGGGGSGGGDTGYQFVPPYVEPPPTLHAQPVTAPVPQVAPDPYWLLRQQEALVPALQPSPAMVEVPQPIGIPTGTQIPQPVGIDIMRQLDPRTRPIVTSPVTIRQGEGGYKPFPLWAAALPLAAIPIAIAEAITPWPDVIPALVGIATKYGGGGGQLAPVPVAPGAGIWGGEVTVKHRTQPEVDITGGGEWLF